MLKMDSVKMEQDQNRQILKGFGIVLVVTRPILNALREFLGSGSWVVVRH